jgi:hypothetical protein
MPIHIVNSDTFSLGVGWLEKELYGEGGFFIMIGKRHICFWKEIDLGR